jgi:hypothetical protein
MFLIAVGAAAVRQQHGDTPARAAEDGGICRVLPDGELSGPFGMNRIGVARLIAFAPVHAANHGFSPGHLYVAHDLIPQCGLSRAAISEFTSTGRFVRCFRGGEDVATRLIGITGMSFAADGRLLVSCGWLTDGILAFTAGGDRVERFAEGPFCNVAVGPTGDVFASMEDRMHGGGVLVLTPDGRYLRRFGRNALGHEHYGLAVDGRSHVFVTGYDDARRTIEEFDADGAPVRTLRVPDGHGNKIAIDGAGRLLLPRIESGSVTVLPLDSSKCSHIDLRGRVRPLCIAAGDEGSIWVGGKALAIA